jgi:hypothetical protein
MRKTLHSIPESAFSSSHKGCRFSESEYCESGIIVRQARAAPGARAHEIAGPPAHRSHPRPGAQLTHLAPHRRSRMRQMTSPPPGDTLAELEPDLDPLVEVTRQLLYGCRPFNNIFAFSDFTEMGLSCPSVKPVCAYQRSHDATFGKAQAAQRHGRELRTAEGDRKAMKGQSASPGRFSSAGKPGQGGGDHWPAMAEHLSLDPGGAGPCRISHESAAEAHARRRSHHPDKLRRGAY